ncbi:MAG: ABC transporter permease [Pseudomonadota bacterium]
MRQIFLIAWREYKQYVFSRGFLLFLIMFPLSIVFLGATLGYLENNKPLRSFVVIDETGDYIGDIDRILENRRLRNGIFVWDRYVRLYVKPTALDEGALAPPFLGDEISDARMRAFVAAGGFEAANAAAAAHLKPGAPAFSPPKPAFERIAPPAEVAGAASMEEAELRLRPYLMGERTIAVDGYEDERTLFAAVLIPAGFKPDIDGRESAAAQDEDEARAQYWSRNLTDLALYDSVSSALNSAFQRSIVRSFGVSDDKLDAIAAIRAPLDSFRPDREAEEAELSLKDRIETGLPAAMTYVLLVVIFGVGNLLLTNTIEERSNKIVEILLSSVTANQLMMGKLIGIGAVGLTMPAVFLLAGGALASLAPTDENAVEIAMAALFSSNLAAVYLFYFLCAYFIFAMIFLAIGAISNSMQDAQSYMGPVMLLVFAPTPFMLLVFQNPNGIVASVLTWIPIYTPYAVMMRAASDPPFWEIAGATVLMLIFAALFARVMGRIFRQAILQAAPPKIKDVLRLARREAA